MSREIDRRSFIVAGAATSAALAGILAGCAPNADGSKTATGEGGAAVTSQGSSATAAAAAIDPAKIVRTEDYDIVVCGSGVAGFSAAARAAELGAKVVCLEICDHSFAPGSFFGFVNTKAILDDGGQPYDIAQYVESLVKDDMGMGDTALYTTFAKANGTVGDWTVSIAKEDGHTITPLGMLSSISFEDYYGMMLSYTNKKGGTVVYQMAARQLVADGSGKITGIIAEDVANSEYVQYNAAKGVILATGGYSGNNDLIRKYIPWVDPDACLNYALHSEQGGANGDAILMCEQRGIPMGAVPHTPEIHFLDGTMPAAGLLYVDALGARLPDDAASILHEIRAQIVMRRPGHSTWWIKDNREYTPSMDTSTGVPKPADAESTPDLPLDDYNTLEELADAFGFDKDIFLATVEQYNNAIETGVDNLYSADMTKALPINTPPYHAQECKMCNLAMIGGPVINKSMQVMGADFRPVAGLYGAGNCVSGFFGINYPSEVKFGINRAFCAVTGYLAAKNILNAS